MKKIKCEDCQNTLYFAPLHMEDGYDLIAIGSNKSSKNKKVPNDIIISRKELIKLLKTL